MGLVECLHAEIVHGPVAAALAARDAVRAEPETAAAIADHSDIDTSVRVAALLALALVAQDGVRVPDAALVALDDDLLIDAVLAIGAASAITGLVCAAGDRIDERQRHYLAVRIRAAGATGMNVAALFAELGDSDAAVAAAMPVIAEALRGGSGEEPVVLALAMLVLDWNRNHPGIAQRIVEALASEPRARFERALRAVDDRR